MTGRVRQRQLREEPALVVEHLRQIDHYSEANGESADQSALRDVYCDLGALVLQRQMLR
jgi:hypothetical protein